MSNKKSISGSFGVDNGEATEMQNFLHNRYIKSPSTGATNALLFAKNVIPLMEREMTFKFTKHELTVISESGKNVAFTPTLAPFKETWIAELKAIVPNIPESIIEKINSLTPCEVYLWRENISLLWKHNQSLNDFLNRWCRD